MAEFVDPDPTFPDGIPIRDAQAQLPHASIPELIVITGMSGAGRSRAAAALEDLDWYVVDNLPPRLLSALVGLISPQGGVRRLAAVVDVRSREYFSELMDVLNHLRATEVEVSTVFLDASDRELVRRYEQVRRPHPLQEGGRLMDGITKERQLLGSLRNAADVVIDTTDLSVHDLARRVRSLVAEGTEEQVRVTVMSFGFKYGLPLDADHVADVRFIPNPYWVTELRHLTGRDHEVADYVFAQDGAKKFARGYAELLEPILSHYVHELKPFVTIAIGCTGGKHRSVAVTEYVAARLRAAGHPVRVAHRDLGRE